MQGNLNPLYLIYTSMLNVQPEGEKTIDYLYSTHRDAHKALPRPPFGKSEHNYILLIPAYKQKLKQEPPVTRSIRKWSVEADAKVQAVLLERTGICFEIHPMSLRSTLHWLNQQVHR